MEAIGTMRYEGMLSTIIVLAVGCGPIGGHGGCSRLGSEPANPLAFLKNSCCFRVGGVGIAAATPPEERSLRRLMRQENAAGILEELFNHGSAAGQLYALLGLYYVDPAKYKSLAPILKHDARMIETQAGCIISEEKVGRLAEFIDVGEYDIYLRRELPDP